MVVAVFKCLTRKAVTLCCPTKAEAVNLKTVLRLRGEATLSNDLSFELGAVLRI